MHMDSVIICHVMVEKNNSKRFLEPNFVIFTLYPEAKVMFGNSFCFLFSKTCFIEYKEKTIFLYFWNQKHVWLVEIKKTVFWKKIENTKICCY